jgi:hypothetical protein
MINILNKKSSLLREISPMSFLPSDLKNNKLLMCDQKNNNLYYFKLEL